MTNNGNGTPGDCFVNHRCPTCRNIRGQACEGSQVRQQCRKCKLYYEGVIEDGHFRLRYVEDKKPRPAPAIVKSANPPTFIG